MICNKFSELSPLEKVMFIGELTHACMANDEIFEMGQKLIKIGMAKGLFDNVKIMPDFIKEEKELDTI